MASSTQNATLRSIGNWDLVEKLADSGMGSVYKARSRANGQVAAIKLLPPFRAGREQAYQRFARECRILSALKDPHIVSALEFGIEGCEPYLVMEFVHGEPLGERLARAGRIPEPEAMRLIVQVAGALGRMHGRGLVHRNVKPDSILITPDGQAMLTDLCLTKEVAQEGLTRDGTALGTPNFMAPEQFRDAAKATRRSDVYSLGATLYMAITGELPFGGCNIVEMCAKKARNELIPPKQWVPTLSDRIDAAIRRAMNAEPFNRPASCDEFVEMLRGSTERAVALTADTSVDQPTADTADLDAHSAATDEVAVPAPASGSAWLWLAGLSLIAAFVSGLCWVFRAVPLGH